MIQNVIGTVSEAVAIRAISGIIAGFTRMADELTEAIKSLEAAQLRREQAIDKKRAEANRFVDKKLDEISGLTKQIEKAVRVRNNVDALVSK